jgi:hypothetical protein
MLLLGHPPVRRASNSKTQIETMFIPRVEFGPVFKTDEPSYVPEPFSSELETSAPSATNSHIPSIRSQLATADFDRQGKRGPKSQIRYWVVILRRTGCERGHGKGTLRNPKN